MDRSISFNTGHILGNDGLEGVFKGKFNDSYSESDLINRINEREKLARELRKDIIVDIPVKKLADVINSRDVTKEQVSQLIYLLNEEVITLNSKITSLKYSVQRRETLNRSEGLEDLRKQLQEYTDKVDDLTQAINEVKKNIPEEKNDPERAAALDRSLSDILATASTSPRT